MAIYSAVPPPEQAPPATTSQAISSSTVDIEAWTISALESLSVSAIATGTGGIPLTIPLDHHHQVATGQRVKIAMSIDPPRRPPSRRDSMKRREALLKGKVGSRQRRRWDNAHLVDVPNVEPPEPSDWEPRPTHVVHHIPYHVAQYWDRGLRQQVEEKRSTSAQKKVEKAGKVPRDLRETVKKAPGVKGWLRALEEPVRQFLIQQGVAEEKEQELYDSEDEEIVFVGRNVSSTRNGGAAKQDSWKKAHTEVHEKPVDTGMVFDSLEDDESESAFKRWLSHSISDFYGLDSRSVNMGNPSRRCVYIGIRSVDKMRPQIRSELPRPLWELL